MVTVYGISNCDRVRSARRWLSDKGIEHAYHDFRKDGLSEEVVRGWVDSLGWEAVVAKRSKPWLALSAEEQAAMDAETAIRAMAAEPTMVKRPVVAAKGGLVLGYQPAAYETLFGGAQ